MSHYDVLGLSRKAKLADVKRAYRRLARKYHPDLNPGDRRAEERFKQITTAYEVLCDSQRRRAYDQEIDAPEPAGFGFAASGSGTAASAASDEFEAAFVAGGSFSSLVSEFFRPAGGAGRSVPQRGDDVTRLLRIGFFESLGGSTTTMEIDVESPCGRCSGSGRVPAAQRRPCPDCSGSGRISRFQGPLRWTTTCQRCEGEGSLGWEGCGACASAGFLTRREEISVRIPPGVDDGSRVRVSGRGRAGRNGGAPGDLFVVTQVEAHPFFRRIGDNIHLTVPITVSEAALGTRIEVPTIDGKARIRIPPGTETGQKFRLRGKGAPSLRGTGRGDQYVETRIKTPRADSDRARAILQDLGSVEVGDDLRRSLLG